MATLEDLKGVLTSINTSIVSQGSMLNLAFGSQEEILSSVKDSISSQTEILNKILRLQKKSDDREEKKSRPQPDTSTVPDTSQAPTEKSLIMKYGEEVGEGLLSIQNSLLAASAALALAFAGLRGWETKVVSLISKSVDGLGDTILKGVKNLKVAALTAFGLDINGKPIPNSTLDNLLKTKVVENFTFFMTKLLAPVKMMGDFLQGVFSGSKGDTYTKKAIDFIGKIGTGIGEFASIVGKILKPLGILFSAYDGIKAFMNTEGSFLEKFATGVGAFVADFVGAPLDLLKNIVSFGIEKLGFENVSKFLDSFSFEDVINDMIGVFIDSAKAAVNWIATLFTDPTEALSQAWAAGTGDGGIIDIFLSPINNVIDFITKVFGWREEDAPDFDLREFISNTFNDIYDSLSSKFTDMGVVVSEKFGELSDYVTTIPDRIKFAAEEMFINVSAKIEKGFVILGDWISSIPSRIKAMALEVLNSISVTNPFTGTEYKLVDDDEVAAARAAISDRTDSTQQKLAEIDQRAAEKKAELNVRMQQSGIYEAASIATAESPVISPETERLMMEAQAKNIRNFQATTEIVENRNSDKEKPVAIVDSSSRTDARTYVGGTTNTTIITPRQLNDLDYGLPRAVQ